MNTHLVLGGNGVVGRETISALLAENHTVAAASRNPSPQAGTTPIVADLLDGPSTSRAVDGATVAYLTVGLPYSTRHWRRGWPVILRNTIDACLAHDTSLVYFDNVYAYGAVHAPMTESTPVRPSSRKGALRADLLRMLDSAARTRGLRYSIGRAADFYGPGASTSAFNTLALDKVAAGKPPTWLFDSSKPHSQTYTPDIGRALVALGTDERALGHTWHLPTAPPLTGADYLEIATGGALPHKTMTTATMRLGALFAPLARETLEMGYQYTAPYIFDSSLMESTFELAPTPYEEGIPAALAHARQHTRETTSMESGKTEAQ